MTYMIRREGAKHTGADVAGALQLMHQFGFDLARFHRRYDLILQPVAATPAPALDAITYRAGDTALYGSIQGGFGFTHLYNMTGQPSMAVPFALRVWSAHGVMLSAASGNDSLLLALAAQMEGQPAPASAPVWSGQ